MASKDNPPPPPRPHWMKDVKRQIQRDVQKGIAGPARTLKSIVVQARVGLILDQHSRQSLHPQGKTAAPGGHGSSSLFHQPLAEVDPMCVANTPSCLVRKLAPRDPEALRVTEKLVAEMRRRSLPEMTIAMMTSYVEENMAMVLRHMEQLSYSLFQRAHEQRMDVLSKMHKHVYPHDVVQSQIALGAASGGSANAFPKRVMHDSDHDVRSTRSGHVPPIDDEFSNGPLERSLTLPVIERTADDRCSKGDTFGAHLGPPRLVLNSGASIEFDPATVASVTINNCSMLHAIVVAQDRLFGKPLNIPDLTLSDVEKEKLRAAPPSPSVMPRVKSFRSISKTPSPELRRQTIFNMRVPILDSAEVSLMLPTSKTARRGTADVVDGSGQSNVPLSLLENLLIATMSDAPSPADGPETSQRVDYDPLCVVCQSARPVSPDSPPRSPIPTNRDYGFQLSDDPAECRRHAESLLSKWKASHDYCAMRQAEELQKAIAMRGSAQTTVYQSVRTWSKVAHRAVNDAKQWCVARSSSPPPVPSPNGGARASSPLMSIWEGPSEELRQESRSVVMCRMFWERLRHFLSLLQYPQSDEQVDFLENLRQLLIFTRSVDKLLLVRWLHTCGPRATTQRDHFRVVQFVRVLLGVPFSSLVKWARLPPVRAQGFDVTTDEA